MSFTTRLVSLLVLTTSIHSISSLEEWEKGPLCGPVELGGFPRALGVLAYCFLTDLMGLELQSWIRGVIKRLKSIILR